MNDEPEVTPPPGAPFTPEDAGYQVIVNEYMGLRRAGADPFSAALITAAHLVVIGAASTAQQQGTGGV